MGRLAFAARALVAASLGLVAACGGNDEAPPPTATTQLDWVLGTLDRGDILGQDLDARFTPRFLESHSSSALRGAFDKVHAAQAPLRLVSFDAPTTDTSLLAVVMDKNDHAMRVDLQLEPDAPRRIDRLALEPNGDADPKLQTWDAVLPRLKGLAPSVGFVAAEMTGAGCAPVQSLAADAPLAIGSNLKLWILAAVAKRVAEGKLAWTDRVALRSDWKSLSPLGYEDDGTTYTVRELAERMIAQSDNTAADHLLFTVGRDQVEAMVTASGHATPARMIPFLSTWDWFTVELLLSDADQRAFLSADEAGRRAKIATFARDAAARARASDALAEWKTPRLLGEAGWFASPQDLCKIARVLQTGGGDALDVLFEATGLPDPKGEWKHLGYKAGSANGLLSTTYLMQRAKDDKWFFVAMVINDPAGTFDREESFYLLGAARGLLAK